MDFYPLIFVQKVMESCGFSPIFVSKVMEMSRIFFSFCTKVSRNVKQSFIGFLAQEVRITVRSMSWINTPCEDCVWPQHITIIIIIIIILKIIVIIMSVFLERLSMWNMLSCAEQVQIQKYKTHAYRTLKTEGVQIIMLKHPTKHKKEYQYLGYFGQARKFDHAITGFNKDGRCLMCWKSGTAHSNLGQFLAWRHVVCVLWLFVACSSTLISLSVYGLIVIRGPE